MQLGKQELTGVGLQALQFFQRMVNQKTYVETKRAVSINMMDPVVAFYFDFELEMALFHSTLA